MLLASDEKIKKATAKFSSDNNLGATSALKVRAIDLFSDDEKISQGHDVASIDNLRQHYRRDCHSVLSGQALTRNLHRSPIGKCQHFRAVISR